MPLTDLDTQLFNIRDPRSRLYYSEALRAYRGGAYRAAISSLWVAVVFDLISKYREVSLRGDSEATVFLSLWDNATRNKDIGKLLKLESSIVSHSSEKMEMVDRDGMRLLTRLREDRHLCAHPAFSADDELFEPIDDVVRGYLSSVVEVLLSQSPVQGRQIIDAFGRDIVSPGFPNAPHHVIVYVDDKYIKSLRSKNFRNLAAVLVKSALLGVPSEWESVQHRVLGSLTCLASRHPSDWAYVRADIMKVINDNNPEVRARALTVLGWFPNLSSDLSDSTRISLKQVVGDPKFVAEHPNVLFAVVISDFTLELSHSFALVPDDTAANLLRYIPNQAFWLASLQKYARSGSFRGAEALFENFISPFAEVATASQQKDLINAVIANGQIWNAALTPGQLANWFKINKEAPPQEMVDHLYSYLGRFESTSRYEPLWTVLSEKGWLPPSSLASA